MIRIHPKVKIPTNITLAFSGGIDSLAIAHFLKRGGRNVTLAHFNHGCEVSDRIETDCHKLATRLNLPIIIKKIDNANIPPGASIENYWRQNRYRWLRSLNETVITGHHLNDAVETWLWSSCHGEGKLIPFESGNIIRPFVLTEKKDFQNYCKNNDLDEVEDECNNDLSLMRNYMRKELIPVIKKINPGINKVIRKKYLQL